MLSPKQRFKVAFLALCADQGLTLPETCALVKFACEELEKRGEGSGGTLPAAMYKSIGGMPRYLLGLALKGGLSSAALGLPMGAAVGYGAAKLTSGINDQTPDEVKARERIDEYDRRAQAARISTLLRQRQQQTRTKRRGRSLI